MKPDEEMHAAVEEVDLDPCDLYTDLGTLIVEGRIPGQNDRGFGEGLHCPISSHGQNRHQCDPSSPECQKYDQILKHMLLLWKNGIPMTIEVLLYPKCCTSFPNVDSVPEMPYILLEQWTIHMLPKRVPDANISPRGLIQAVRSFLYFSQLCAWYSLTGGKSPENVHYRVCVPGEAFSSKFSSQPDCHIFPVANVGRSTAMKVLVKCHPRCGAVPSVPCLKHADPPLLSRKGTMESPLKLGNTSVREYVYDGILPTAVPPRTSSPADTMLGESLLDPPNSLCMYQKRYQSPSRCGSPSMEVPEHLMFGKTNAKTEEKAQRRSRPQRRPVVERFLKKNLGENVQSIPESSKPRIYDNRKSLQMFDKQLGSVPHTPNILSREDVLGYHCLDEYMKHVPRKEMEEVLEQLRDKQRPHRTYNESSVSFHGKGPPNKTLSDYMKEMTLSPEDHPHKNTFFKVGGDELSVEHQICDTTPKTISFAEKLPPPTEVLRLQASGQKQKANLLPNKFKLLHSEQDLLRSLKLQDKGNRAIKSPSAQPASYWGGVLSSDIYPKHSSVNIKKLGTFIPKTHELVDERAVSGHDAKFNTSPENILKDEATPNTHEVPSAEKKALFRRSLDSATSLVFHQRSGLPLTSSPAPIRKCGTCFDFDSTLTSVSAIKRALFEKDPEEETEPQDNSCALSTSAPASIFSSSLLGTFEESVLNGRLEPVSTVEGFTAEIGASGSFCPRHIKLPVTVFFYTLHDMDKVTSPYMGHINLKGKDYHVPKKGTVQVTLFNPHGTVVKMFVVRYDLGDMPVNCQTFLRQRTLYMPSDAGEGDSDAQKWLRYLIHLRFMSSKSGRIYLHTDIRVIVFRKSDLDAATVHGLRPYELCTFTHGPLNPKFSPHKP